MPFVSGDFWASPFATIDYSNYNTCWSCRMTDKVSTMDVRARIGDMLNRVALRHDEFIIERKGKALAALVPIERLEQIRRFARQHALEFLKRQKGGQAISFQKKTRWTWRSKLSGRHVG